MRIVFAGSPTAAVPTLDALASSSHDVIAVVTREDSPQGRRGILTPTPVAIAAEAQGLPIIRANRLGGEVTDAITALAPDLGVIVAYGGLVREPLLSVPRLGWVNLHFSLLPRWRGAAPVQHAIMAGDTQTGAVVFRLVQELDAGDVLGTIVEPIGGNQTAGHLLGVLAEAGSSLVVQVVDELETGTALARPQHGAPTFAPKLTAEDGRIDFERDARAIHDRIRGVTPEPGAFTFVDGTRLKIIDATIARGEAPLTPGLIDVRGNRVLVGTASDPVELQRVQPAGRTAMDAAAWWRGRPSGSTAVTS
jgi:methionyl-tRNA formyltransferase